MATKAAFDEYVTTEADDEYIGSHVNVYTDDDGYFVYVETDSCEGVAMMTLPCAVKCHEALGRAIEAATAERLTRKPGSR